jgi:catechol 2,3-dioxygenase-like lactoylglutathione lyase family enzyme
MKMMIDEMNHVSIQIENLKECMEFYTGVLGARVFSRYMLGQGDAECVYIQLGGGLVELISPSRPTASHQFGYDHIAFMTDDLDGDYEAIMASGHSSVLSPRPAASGNGRLAFVYDPSGVKVELIQRERVARLPPTESELARRLDHFVIMSSDLDASAVFYTECCAMKKLADEGIGAQRRIYLAHGDDTIEVLYSHPGVPDQMVRAVALRVDDFEAEVDYLEARGVGVSIVNEGAGKGGGTATFADPEGNNFQLLDRREMV